MRQKLKRYQQEVGQIKKINNKMWLFSFKNNNKAIKKQTIKMFDFDRQTVLLYYLGPLCFFFLSSARFCFSWLAGRFLYQIYEKHRINLERPNVLYLLPTFMASVSPEFLMSLTVCSWVALTTFSPFIYKKGK